MRHLAGTVLAFSLGCADGTSPVEPSPSPPAPPQLTFTLAGDVRDTASRPLKGASVTVVNGPQAGTTVTTDDRGRFSMPGTFTQSSVTVTAANEGYSPLTRSFPPPNRPVADGVNWWFSFSLEPLAPSANLSGDYTLTLSSNKACTKLPEEARTRVYKVSIVARGRTAFEGTLGGARMVPVPVVGSYFGIGVAGDFADLSLRLVEQLSDGTYLAIEGRTAATVQPSGITGPFNAQFVRCGNQPSWAPGEYLWCGADVEGDECASGDNQLALVRNSQP
jgi:hypothetical protein